MAFVTPRFEKHEVNRAGKFLSADISTTIDNDWIWAYEVLANWRACHGYPINTFQSLLRKRVKENCKNGIVAQRLKRAPSVIAKLQRFKTMKLAQMQDIGGLRAVVDNVAIVRKLKEMYINSNFMHELISSKDYISNPKDDGYRSIHLVYKYFNNHSPEFNELLLEIQLRSRMQHSWATAVETMGTFLGQALKSGQGDKPWREFFEIASAAFTHLEKTEPIPAYASFSKDQILSLLGEAENNLHVLNKLQGFSIAANKITSAKGAGSYHLVILNSSNRTVSIKPFPKTQLEQANFEYAKVEERGQQGEPLEAVLVSAGPVEALKKAYPNYFLDTHEFVLHIKKLLKKDSSGGIPKKSSFEQRKLRRR